MNFSCSSVLILRRFIYFTCFFRCVLVCVCVGGGVVGFFAGGGVCGRFCFVFVVCLF